MSKSYAILGFGKSGQSVWKYLQGLKESYARVYVSPDEASRLRASFPQITFATLGDRICEEIIIRSPGIRPDVPYIARACADGARLTTETELFVACSPARVYAVTGSDGKTTTATLAARMLEVEGHIVHLGGNIGLPLLDRLSEMDADHCVVLELSSFQLMHGTYPLAAAAVTNLTENHLDWHTGMAEYKDAKRNILTHAARRVQNARMPIAPEFSSLTFSAYTKAANYYVAGDYMMHGEEPLLPLSRVKLPGRHNLENLLCAAALTGVRQEAFATVATTFDGVAHRLEYCGTVRGVGCYNSSIDTTPSRTAATLAALGRGLTVVCGGAGKNLSWEPLAECLSEYAAQVVFTGAVGQEMEDALVNYMAKQMIRVPQHIYCGDAEAAWNTALDKTPFGGTLVLSPAATSFDAFASYAARGDAFRLWVKNNDHCR